MKRVQEARFGARVVLELIAMSRFAGKLCLLEFVGMVLSLDASRTASGQSFSFGISTGHGHHHGWHHHHGCWPGPYCGPYWGPSFGVVYAPPPPVVRERVVYVEPRVSAAPPVVTPPLAARPAPVAGVNALPADTSITDDRIVIRNTSGANLPVAFLVDGQDVELADGSTRTFIGKARRTVTYDRGARFGSTQQELAAGHYEFRVTASGWDLVRRPDLPTSGRTAVRSNSLPEGDAVR
jgi:hypothetical protein